MNTENATAVALTTAMTAYKPRLIEAFKDCVRRMFDVMQGEFGHTMANIANSRRYASWSETVRPCCTAVRTGDLRGTVIYAIGEDQLARRAEVYADATMAAWFGKITGKLGELEHAEVTHLTNARFNICGTKNGRQIRIDQDMILNVSPKGKLFNQFPARIYCDGKFISEANFKKL